jgi:hypothetical protein
MRSLLITLPLSLSVLGCTSEPEIDELAGEVPEDDIVDGKADSAANGVYTYFSIKGDTRKCASPFCGGFHLARVNRSTTTCHDGKSSDSCYTPELDFSESNLSQATQYKLTTAAANGAFDNGVKALVRGRFAKKSLGPVEPQLGRFIVTEAWVSQSDAVSDGVFVKVHDNGLRCIAAPCPSLTEKGLNTSRSASISEVDFSPAGLADEQIGNLMQHMFEASGLIVVGDRFTYKIGGRKGKGRTATAVFAKLTDVTACAGTVVSGPSSFIDSADGMQCEMPETHCLTTDHGACPQLSPLPPDFCSDGTIVKGEPSFIDSADGMECQMPSVHCVTKDHGACPQFSPLPPDFCSAGTIARGPSSFIPSADGKECEIPSIHCVTNDAGSCPLF